MIFIGVPLAIGVTGRWDFYFTLTSVALLAIASAGVWLTFYIGRINIGQGAFALIGAYVSAILVVKADWSFWISLPAAGLFAAVVAILIGLPILRLRGVYFAMITLVLTQVVTLTALALPITNGARGISNIPLPSGISVFGIPILPDFAAMENTKLAFYYTACIIMLANLCGALSFGEFSPRASVPLDATERRTRQLYWGQYFLHSHRDFCHLQLFWGTWWSHVRINRAVGLSVQLPSGGLCQLHAELLSWRSGVCFWPNAGHASPILRMGPIV